MLFSKEHIWLNVEGDIAEVGLTQYKKDKMGKIIFVDMSEEGDSINKGDTLFEMEFAKTQSEFESPVTGTILECNEDILDDPDILNDECQGNYILKIKLSDMEETKELLSDEEYNGFCEN